MFALNGALTAVRAELGLHLRGINLGMFTVLGGGTWPCAPGCFAAGHLRRLALSGARSRWRLIAFALSRRLERLTMPITVLDAVGLECVRGPWRRKVLNLGFGVVQGMILVGTITAVGGGTIRDVMIGSQFLPCFVASSTPFPR